MEFCVGLLVLALSAHRSSNAWTAVVCGLWLVGVTCAGDEAALHHIQQNYTYSTELYIHTSERNVAIGKLRPERRLLIFGHCANTHRNSVICMAKLHMYYGTYNLPRN